MVLFIEQGFEGLGLSLIFFFPSVVFELLGLPGLLRVVTVKSL